MPEIYYFLPSVYLKFRGLKSKVGIAKGAVLRRQKQSYRALKPNWIVVWWTHFLEQIWRLTYASRQMRL